MERSVAMASSAATASRFIPSPSSSLPPPAPRCRAAPEVAFERRRSSSVVVVTSANSHGDSPSKPSLHHHRSVSLSQDLLASTAAPPDPPIPVKPWNLPDSHLLLLSAVACVTGASLSALFLSAIPTMLALKKAAESLEKLMDTTREELPGTMAAIRLSGMEISDLTMELSEIGQEISSGVKNSARVVRAAQDGLRRVSGIATTALLQDHVVSAPKRLAAPTASVARGLRESLAGMRTMFRSIITLRYVTVWLGKLWSMQRQMMLQGQKKLINSIKAGRDTA